MRMTDGAMSFGVWQESLVCYAHANTRRPLHFWLLCFALIVLEIISSRPAMASGLVTAAFPSSTQYCGYMGCYPTPDTPCNQILQYDYSPPLFSSVVYTGFYTENVWSFAPGWYTGGRCGATVTSAPDASYPNGIIYSVADTINIFTGTDICPANSQGLTGSVANVVSCTCNSGYTPNSSATACVAACPAHAHPTNVPAAPCACNATFMWDANKTSCIPEAVCPIPPLTPLTDQAAIDFESGNSWRPDLLTPAYQIKLSCVQNGITNRGGRYANTSAYRPTQYQRHLSEIVGKERDLTVAGYMDAHPECQALLNTVTGEMAAHHLRHRQAVAAPNTSRHESGTAFDVTPIGLTDAQIAPIYSSCGVSNAVVAGERWHVQ